MKLTEQEERNEKARNQIAKVVKENGLKWSFVADKIQIHQSHLSHWRSSKYQFGKNRLEKLESLISKYENI